MGYFKNTTGLTDWMRPVYKLYQVDRYGMRTFA